MIEILVTCIGEESKVLRFEEARIRIGRNEDNDLVLSSKACSRYHAEIVREGEAYRLIDLGSSNKIRIGSRTLTELMLVDGSTLQIGEHTLTFSLEEDPAEKTVMLEELQEPITTEDVETYDKTTALYLRYRRKGEAQNSKIVEGTEYVIGRAPDADIVIDDSRSSAHHATIFSKAGKFYIRDTNSSNGTVVNEKKIEETSLEAGSRILIGSTQITVCQEKHDLADEAALTERTVIGGPTRGLDNTAAKGADTASTDGVRRSAKVTVIALAVVATISVAVSAVMILRDGNAIRDEAIDGGQSTSGTNSRGTSSGELIVQVAPIEAKELVSSVDGTGTVSPGRSVTVSAEVLGRILDMPAGEGTVVSRGQLLASINDRDIRLQIDEARSAVSLDQVELAREDFERKQRLFDEGVTTRSVLDQAKNNYLSLDSAYQSVQAKIRQLEEQLSKTRILAPFPGRVVKKFLNEGEFSAPGTPLVTLENMDEVVVELELSDRDIVKVQKGQTVEANIDAFPGRTFQGVVDNIASAAHPVSRTFGVEARIGNRDGSLRSGLIANLRIILEKTDSLVVPAEALLDRRGDEADVFVVAEGTARKVTARLGRTLNREVEVVKGLAEGDLVVVYGKEQVSDGQPIDSYQRQ